MTDKNERIDDLTAELRANNIHWVETVMVEGPDTFTARRQAEISAQIGQRISELCNGRENSFTDVSS